MRATWVSANRKWVNRKNMFLVQYKSVLSEFLCFYKYIPGWLLEKDTWAHSTCSHSCALWLVVYAVGGNPLTHSLVPRHIVMVEFPSSDTP